MTWPFVFRKYGNVWWLVHTTFSLPGDVPCVPDHQWGQVEGDDLERLER